jgi:hypothetical protein
MLINLKVEFRLESFDSLNAEAFPVKAIELKKYQLTRDAAFKGYRNVTEISTLKRKNEFIKNNFDFCLDDADNFSKLLSRKRKADIINTENIDDIDQVLNIIKTKSKDNNINKYKGPKNNTSFNYNKNKIALSQNNINNKNYSTSNNFESFNKPSDTQKIQSFNNHHTENFYKSKKGINILKKKGTISNHDFDFYHSKEDSISNIDETNLFMNGSTYKKNFFNCNFNNNVENEFSEGLNFELKSRDNSSMIGENNRNYNYKKHLIKKSTLLKNKSSINNNHNNSYNFFPENKKENLLLNEHKEKEIHSNNLSSEKTDINAIKKETSSVISIKSKTRNDFETVRLGNELIKISELPEKMQLRDRSKNNKKHEKDQEAKSVNSFKSQTKKKKDLLKSQSFENSFYNCKSFRSNNNYRQNNINCNSNNFYKDHYKNNQSDDSSLYINQHCKNNKGNEEFEKRLLKYVDNKFSTLKRSIEQKLIKFGKMFNALMEKKIEKAALSKKYEKKEKVKSNHENVNGKNEAKEKRGRKPKKPKIAQLEREELNLKINDVKKSLYFIRGFKKLFNVKGEQEYNFNLYELKDGEFLKLKKLVDESSFMLNGVADSKNKQENISINNNQNENFDVRSVLSNNLIINNNMNPILNKIKQILDDSISGSSLSSSSDCDKSKRFFKIKYIFVFRK